MKKVTKEIATSVKKDSHRKMSSDELQMFLHFKKRGAVVPAKKGKGSYDRKKLKKVCETP